VPGATPAGPNAASIPASSLAPLAPTEAPSLLQQPAEEAQIVFNANRLEIKAHNASLSAILHQFSTTSGMKVEGLGGDERVFGTFGPGVPRDVLADLMNGTAYNLVLLGDLQNGAPRELLLTPAGSHAASSPVPTPQMANNNDDAAEPERAEEPPPPPPDTGQNPPPNSGVKTPQQLFEQLQKMRQNQGQGPQQPVQQDSPMQ
jgi:hypothetical protein